MVSGSQHTERKPPSPERKNRVEKARALDVDRLSTGSQVPGLGEGVSATPGQRSWLVINTYL